MKDGRAVWRLVALRVRPGGGLGLLDGGTGCMVLARSFHLALAVGRGAGRDRLEVTVHLIHHWERCLAGWELGNAHRGGGGTGRGGSSHRFLFLLLRQASLQFKLFAHGAAGGYVRTSGLVLVLLHLDAVVVLCGCGGGDAEAGGSTGQAITIISLGAGRIPVAGKLLLNRQRLLLVALVSLRTLHSWGLRLLLRIALGGAAGQLSGGILL